MPAASRTSAPASAVIAVIAALDFERKLLDDHAPADERSRVRVYQCGPGDAHAYDAARSALASGAAALVSWGVAGGLAPRSRAGDVVLPRRVLAATGMSFDADPVWRMELYRSLQAIFAVADGDLCSSPEVLGSSAAKSALAESTGAVAVDMESAAVARAAKAAGCPFVAIRIVLDTLGDSLPRGAEHWMDADGNRSVGAVLTALMNPARWMALLRLNRRYREAQHVLDDLAAMLASSDFFYPHDRAADS